MKLFALLESIEARLSEVNTHLVFLCHLAEKVAQNENTMQREPSVFSYIKALEVGYSVSLMAGKEYAARCACDYLKEEYGYTYSITSQEEGLITITRLA